MHVSCQSTYTTKNEALAGQNLPAAVLGCSWKNFAAQQLAGAPAVCSRNMVLDEEKRFFKAVFRGRCSAVRCISPTQWHGPERRSARTRCSFSDRGGWWTKTAKPCTVRFMGGRGSMLYGAAVRKSFAHLLQCRHFAHLPLNFAHLLLNFAHLPLNYRIYRPSTCIHMCSRQRL